MVKRITYGTGLLISPGEEARQLLRTKHLPDGEWSMDDDLVDVLVYAYPEASTKDDRGNLVTDWKALALAVAREFVPAFQPGAAQGRPQVAQDGLVEAVHSIMASGEAKSITHACSIIERRALFPEITDIRKAYYRRKKLSPKIAP